MEGYGKYFNQVFSSGVTSIRDAWTTPERVKMYGKPDHSAKIMMGWHRGATLNNFDGGYGPPRRPIFLNLKNKPQLNFRNDHFIQF